LIKPIQIALVFILLISVGCRTTKGIKSEGLDYKQRKLFENFYYEASKHKVLNNNDKALQSYKKALEVYPESHAAMYQLAKLYYQMNQYSEALMWAEQSVKVNPSYNKWYSGQLAQFYNRFGKYEESAEVFKSMILAEPENRKYYIEASNQYFNSKKTEEAIAVLKEMQTKFGIEEVSSTRLEYIYSKLEKNELAVSEMQKLVNQYPENVDYQGYLANSLLRAGKTDEAIKILEAIKTQDENSGLAHFALYELYSQQGKRSLAFQNLKVAFTKDDISIQQKLQSISSYFLVLKKSKIAQIELLELSDLLMTGYSTQVEPYILKADYHSTLEENNKARKYLLQGIEIDPSDFRTWSKLLGINAKIGNPKYQVIDAGRAIELFPNNSGLYAAKAYAELDLEKFQDAINTVDEGLEIVFEKQDKVELLLCKASCLSGLKQHEKSDEVFEEILILSPNNATAINNYAYSLAERKERLEYADSLCNQALKLESTNPYFMDTKAWILYQMKDFEGSIEWLNKAMLLNPNDVEILIHARQVYLKLGNQTMANEMQSKIELLRNEK
jgi:tetratricopeptide (TPR) repeat protein